MMDKHSAAGGPARGAIPSNLEEEILRLKREMNAVILAHYYQEDDIQDIADIIAVPCYRESS